MAKSTIFIIPEVGGKEPIDASSISFDAVSSFSPSRSRSISNSPLSDGSFVSEILTEKGGKVSMEAYAANNPVIINQKNLINSNSLEGRAQAAYLALDTLYKSQNTVTIVHRFDTLNNYFLTSFEPILMPSDTIGFKLEFEEVRFVSEQRVTLITNMSEDKAKENDAGVNKGQGNIEEVEEGSAIWVVIKDVFSFGTGGGL